MRQLATQLNSPQRCLPLAHSPIPARGRQLSVAVRANDNRKVDWDKEWNNYVNDKQTSPGGSSSSSARSNVRTSRRAVPVDPAAKMTRDAIKREESILLNAWSSGAFQGAGAAVAVVVLLAILLAAGPPPADSRCTLPWC